MYDSTFSPFLWRINWLMKFFSNPAAFYGLFWSVASCPQTGWALDHWVTHSQLMLPRNLGAGIACSSDFESMQSGFYHVQALMCVFGKTFHFWQSCRIALQRNQESIPAKPNLLKQGVAVSLIYFPCLLDKIAFRKLKKQHWLQFKSAGSSHAWKGNLVACRHARCGSWLKCH